MRTRRGISAGLVLGLALAGCTDPRWSFVDEPISRTPAAIISTTCPTDAGVLGVGTPEPGPTPGAIPKAFVPTTVLRCEVTGPASPPSTESRFIVVEETAPITDQLLAALALPDQDFAPGAQNACTADGEVAIYLLLVDARQHAIRPIQPRNPCHRRPEVDQAVGALTFTTIKTYTVASR